MKFSEALAMLKKGHCLRRESWFNDEWSIKVNKDGDLLSSYEEEDHTFNISDFTAKDWIVV